jgi:predicted Rossmann fold flavoprotein
VNKYDLIVIGGGASGFFGAIQAGSSRPNQRILILEKSTKVLSKVKVSGGGRCNVTHHCFDPVALSKHYPRGEKFLRKLFQQFQARDVVEWFKSRGVALTVEADGRMFPESNTSQTIIDCFMREVERLKISLELGVEVTTIQQTETGLIVHASNKAYSCKNVLVATGGHPSLAAYQLHTQIGQNVQPPIPSLFTFNDSQKLFTDLMGLSVSNAEVKIASTKFSQQGPLLITHWGLSGPAVIKLSAWAAEYLSSVQYQFTALVSWIGPAKEDEIRSYLLSYRQDYPKRRILGHPLFQLPMRLWQRLCALAISDLEKMWGEMSNKDINRLLEFLIRTPFVIKGKTTFKEEFVTCGGVLLSDVNPNTLESKAMPHVYFAGEALNIDGETGGFNFQAAWTTAYIAVTSMQ